MWVVKCQTCLDETKRQKRWRETCKDCADETALKHIRETGHLVDIEVTGNYEHEELPVRRRWWQ